MVKTNLNILIDTELKARLKTLAERENRNLSNLVETELKRLVGMLETDSQKNRQDK